MDDDPPVRKAPVKVSAEFGQFNKHGKGFGAKYLEKFGFQAGYGLGKDGKGISQPIMVKVRPEKKGIGADGFQEATSLKANREVASQYFKKTGEKEEERATVSDDSDEEVEQDEWKAAPSRSKPRKEKTKYKTAAQVMAAAEGGGSGGFGGSNVIVDMRGPSVRVLPSIAHSADEKETESAFVEATGREYRGKSKATGPMVARELAHNSRQLAEAAEVALLMAKQRRDAEADKMNRLTAEAERLQSKTASGYERVTVLSTALKLLQNLSDACESGAATIATVSSDLIGIRNSYPKAWFSLGLHESVGPALEAVLSCIVRSWSPLHGSDVTLAQLVHCARVLCEIPVKGEPGYDPAVDEGSDDDNDAVNGSVFRHNLAAPHERSHRRSLRQSVAQNIKQAITGAVDRVVGPSLSKHILQKWDVKTDTTAAVWCCEALEVLGSKGVYDALLTGIHGKLYQSVEECDVRVPIHTWVLPWLPIIGEERMGTLWPTIKRKFEGALRDWVATDSSAKVMLSPWNKIPAFATVFTRCILPKLADSLRKIDLNPANSDATIHAVSAVESVLSWQHILPEAYIGGLIEGGFLPLWYSTLLQWLASPHCDLGDVEEWYMGWRHTLTRQFIANDVGVMSWFVRALQVLSDAIADGGPGSPAVFTAISAFQEQQRKWAAAGTLIPRFTANNAGKRVWCGTSAGGKPSGYVRVVQERMSQAKAVSTAATRMQTLLSSGGSGSLLNFLEVLAVLADRRGLSVLPHDRRHDHEGKRLYQCGPATFFVYNDVVFLEKSVKVEVPAALGLHNTVSTFIPVSVEELFAAGASFAPKK